MKFVDKHREYLQNALKIMRRCTLPNVESGEEYIVFTQTYYFLADLLQQVDNELKAEQVLKQSMQNAANQPQSNTTSTQAPKNGLIPNNPSPPKELKKVTENKKVSSTSTKD